jgi:molybdate transport system substrate-binding protein
MAPTSRGQRCRWAIICLLLMWLGPQSVGAADARVAVASNFADTARSLGALFGEQSGHRLAFSSASTGKLYAQIANGAPFDVFLAADAQRPRLAEQAGLAVGGSRFTYARGRLVLWSNKPSLPAHPHTYLTEAPFTHLSIANPAIAPYGKAALQVLAHLGIRQKIQHKLLMGDSAAQSFQFVISGNAEAGLLAQSQVLAWRGRKGSTWPIPARYHRPIHQDAVLLTQGLDNPAARAFIDFLKTRAARELIAVSGYSVE